MNKIIKYIMYLFFVLMCISATLFLLSKNAKGEMFVQLAFFVVCISVLFYQLNYKK